MSEPHAGRADRYPAALVALAGAVVLGVVAFSYFAAEGEAWQPDNFVIVLGIGLTFAAPLVAVLVTGFHPGVRMVMGVAMILDGWVLSTGGAWPLLFIGLTGVLLLFRIPGDQRLRLGRFAYWTIIVLALLAGSFYSAYESWPLGLLGSLALSALVVVCGLRIASTAHQ